MTNGEHQALAVFEKYKKHISTQEKLKKLAEEVNELTWAFSKDDKENINEEIGDCAAIILHLAYRHNDTKTLINYILEAAEKIEQRNTETITIK